MIRYELGYPGSFFFKGDSIRYIQVITTHGLIMIFFVVVPIIFGFLANFFIPYHVGSKDVAFPRLNSIGFWIQPAGFLLLFKLSFFRPNRLKKYDNTVIYKSFFNNTELMYNKFSFVPFNFIHANRGTQNTFSFWNNKLVFDKSKNLTGVLNQNEIKN